jgi:hypothetical protein
MVTLLNKILFSTELPTSLKVREITLYIIEFRLLKTPLVVNKKVYSLLLFI